MEAAAATAIPTWVYVAIVTVLLGNIGTIFSVLYAAFKIVWWARGIDMKVDASHRRMDEHVKTQHQPIEVGHG